MDQELTVLKRVINIKGEFNGSSYLGISSLKDFNNDNINDAILSTSYSSPFERFESGIVYVLYGKSNVDIKDIDLKYLHKKDGFKIIGAYQGDHTGSQVSDAGDINADGYNDIIIGADEKISHNLYN